MTYVLILAIVGLAYGIFRQLRSALRDHQHVSPMDMKRYFEGHMRKEVEEKNRITRHLGTCQSCRDLLFRIQSGAEDPEENSPRQLIKRGNEDNPSKMKRRFTR